jgi:hypothetical protein
MASRLDQFQGFVLTFQSPWNLAGMTTHNWSQSMYVSGTIDHNDAEAEAAGLALAAPALALASSKTSLIGIKYYKSQSLVSTTNKEYAPGTHPGTASAYNALTEGAEQQLEVAAVAHGAIGKNSKGKTVYLRKYFHDVAAGPSDPNALAQLTDATALLHPFIVGAGPHAVVPVSPAHGTPAPVWTMEAHLFTHQLRKGKKKKKPSAGLIATVEHLVGDTLDAATLAKIIEAVG